MEKFYINEIPFERIKNYSKLALHYKALYSYAICNGKNQKELSDCYKSYSSTKENAYYICDMLREKLDGFGKYIIGYNDNFFTYAFIATVNCEPYLIVMTAYRSMCIRLTREELDIYIENGLQK